MTVINGTGTSDGIASGPIFFYKTESVHAARRTVADVQGERARFEKAQQLVMAEYERLAQQAEKDLSKDEAQIFQIYAVMLSDDDFSGFVIEMIERERVCAEYAVQQAEAHVAQLLAESGDSYIAERTADVKEIASAVLNALAGKTASSLLLNSPHIVFAEECTPADIMQLDKRNILALVTVKGSRNCHAAILARGMGIPAVSELREIPDGQCAEKACIVDGEAGVVYIAPDEKTALLYAEKKANAAFEKEALRSLIGKEARTKDGRAVELFANIGNQAEARHALENDADGIGLFRSEFLYLNRLSYPDEETLFAAYKTVAAAMGKKKVIIRTIDIGADKQASYFNMPKEENPALGVRAIRISLTRPEIFKTQLRAILRASAFGNVAIMFPMIISVSELQRAKQLVEEAKNELAKNGIAFDEHIEIGSMIETPAAAIISDELARECDFFSIGTNDLTQYTLAIDRQNETASQFLDAHHPALLRLIELTVKNAHAAGIKAGICGELGSDSSLTETFLKMGIDELSVPPNAILPLKQKIRLLELRPVPLGSAHGGQRMHAYADAIVDCCGGSDNIDSLSCCATRLRIMLKDASLFDEARAKAIPDVAGVLYRDGQPHIVLGLKAVYYYELLQHRRTQLSC
ncbi:MAG: phosphoenolpyruvate--protein phosphotransferase [Treponema sp.]|nr:phosphoenolpyruvate--protein phosphotransferase [Treponema sp.]